MHPLQKLLESAELETRSYSGRGMYGKSCLGVDVRNFNNFLQYYTEALIENIGELKIDERIAIVDAICGCCTDQMGLGMIVYFPDVPYTVQQI